MPHDGKGFQFAQGAQVPTQGNSAPNAVGGNDVPELTNWDIRESLLALALAAKTHTNMSW